MKKEKLTQVLVGAILVALGILVAIFGTGAFDIYFGIIAIGAGAILLALAIALMVKKQVLAPTAFILPAVLLAVGITLFTPYIGFEALEQFIVVLVLGLGAGLLLYGCYLIGKKAPIDGVVNIVIGVVALTLSILFITVHDFEKAFWVIVGVVIALYGVLEIVTAFLEKK